MLPRGSNFLRTVVLVGVGVIGSYLVSHLTRLSGLRHLTLIDPDDYEHRNLQCQEIELRDVGRPKAVVQARRAQRIAPDLAVTALRARVESVPAGLLRAGLVVTATDSLGSRRAVADRVWPLGVPWVDAGVQGAEKLARVTSYLPGEDRPCIECAWDERHYAAADRSHSCLDQVGSAPPTNASAGLGAMAAALQAQVCEGLWDSGMSPDGFGQEIILDLARHHSYVCTLRRNRDCRRPRHGAWEIEISDRSPSDITVKEMLSLADPRAGAGSPYLRVLGSAFAGRLVCPNGCGREKQILRLEAALGRTVRKCLECGGPMSVVGFDTVDRLTADELEAKTLRRTLGGLGLRAGDVVTVGRRGSDRERHFEMKREGETGT